MRTHAGTLVVGVVGALLITAGLAAAAERCHQDLPGTRSLALEAHVTSYRFSGGRVVVRWARSEDCTGTAAWDYASQRRTTAAPLVCRRAAVRELASVPRLAASDARHAVRVLLAPESSDVPDRLLVFERATNRRLAAWPLLDRPARVAVHDGIAILSASSRNALYALRLADGRIAQIGISRPGDRPLIGPAGVVYQDDLDRSKRRSAPQERTLKLLPLATVRQELGRPFTTVRTYMSYSKPAPSATRTGAARAQRPPYLGADPPRPFKSSPITAIAMDGPRVALAVGDPSGRCDYILFWNVAWRYATRLTRASGPTCLPTHAPGGITDVAIAGSRAVWTATYGGNTRVLAASITDCQEWVVARPEAGAERVAGLAGDGGILAYALRDRAGGERRLASVGVVPKLWRGALIDRSSAQVRAIAADGDIVAVLNDGGLAKLISRDGTTLAALHVGQARAVALRPGTLAVLTARGTIDLYRTATRRRVASWPAPAGATTLDLHHGIALVTAGRDVHAVDVATGRAALLFRAPTAVRAQLESPGTAIQFNAHGEAHLRFLPLAAIEARLR